jgi:hypothetical protein
MPPYAWIGQIFNFLAGAVYQTAPTPLQPGSGGPLLCDANGRLIVTLNVPGGPIVANGSQIFWSDSTAYGGTGVIKAAPGTLFQITGVNDTASAAWLQIFDSATVPAASAVPKFTYKLATNEKFCVTFPLGRPFAAGITWGLSSTGNLFTAQGTPLAWVNAQYG